jgi:hypothetical protein
MTTFTGTKLDWLKCMRFDRRVTDHAYRVVSVIADHLNEDTGRTWLSAETIAFEVGYGSPRAVGRAIKVLKDTGWITVYRTGAANVFEPNFRNVKTWLAALGRARFERRQIYLERKNDPSQIGRKRPIR